MFSVLDFVVIASVGIDEMLANMKPSPAGKVARRRRRRDG